MSKRVKTLLISLSALVVLGAIVFVLLYFFTPVFTTQPTKTALYVLDRKSINYIDIDNVSSKYTLQKTGDEWDIIGMEDVPVSSNAISVVLIKYQSMGFTRLIEENVEDMGKYGFDSPLSTVNIKTTLGDDVTFMIGRKSPTGEGYYIRMADENNVYLVDDIVGEIGLDSGVRYLEKMLYPLVDTADFANTMYVNITGKNREYDMQFKRKSDEEYSDMNIVNVYDIVANNKYSVGITEGDDFLKLMFSGSQADAIVDYHIDDAKAEKYGLNDPSYVLEFMVNGDEYKVTYGSLTEDGTQRYAVLDGRDVVYAYNVTRLEFLDTENKDMIERMVMLKMITTVKTITVTSAEASHEFRLVYDSAGELSVKTQLGFVDTDIFKNYYQVILQIMYEDQCDVQQNTEPMLTVDFAFNDGTSMNVQFIPFDDDARKCYVLIDGKGDFYVFKKDVQKLIDDAQNVVDGNEVTTII